MPTINLGRIGFVSKGTYNGSTAYKVNDVVTYYNKVYACIQAGTGNTPTNTSYWVNWIGDTNASSVIVTPTGGISSTDVQAALAELDTEKATKATTLSGYGITDATPSSHIGTGGSAHAEVTTTVNGFMSSTDKSKLDTITAATATPNMDSTASVGVSTKYAREDHTHPSDTTKQASNATLTSVAGLSTSTTGLMKLTNGTASLVTGTTGSGNIVYDNSPTLITPNIGTATGTSFNSITGLSSTTPLIDGTAAIGTSTTAARADHIHPNQSLSGLNGVALSSPTVGQLLSYNGTNWVNVASSGFGATGGGTDKVFYENNKVVTTSYSITSGNNAMSAGPLTVNDGVTVTIPDGSSWTIV